MANQSEIVELLKKVQKEGVTCLGPCAECEKRRQLESKWGVSWETEELTIARITYSGFTP